MDATYVVIAVMIWLVLVWDNRHHIARWEDEDDE